MSLRSRLNEIRKVRRSIDAERRAAGAVRRSLLQREGIVDLVERQNRLRYNDECPERSVHFGLDGPPRQYHRAADRSWGSFTAKSKDPLLDTTGRPDNVPTIERAF